MKRTPLIIILALLGLGCGNNHVDLENEPMDSIMIAPDDTLPSIAWDDDFISPCLNSVAGHDERDTIVGNFTGHGIDSIFIIKSDPDISKDFEVSISYYAFSNNKKIPKVELYGHAMYPPHLVFEGDLDGNGTDEWGYLHTWLNSQWRYYRVFTLVNGQWRYLIESDKLDTPEWFRCSGQEIIEPAGKPGYVKIHYGTFYPDIDTHDTIEKVTFSIIKD